MALCRLVYTSVSASDPSSPLVHDEIEAILAASRRNNEALGVTGALLFTLGRFAQVLEGEEEAVRDLYQTIYADPRHGSVTVIAIEPIPERTFGAWSMAYAGDESAAAARYAALSERVADGKGSLGSDDVVRILADHLVGP